MAQMPWRPWRPRSRNPSVESPSSEIPCASRCVVHPGGCWEVASWSEGSRHKGRENESWVSSQKHMFDVQYKYTYTYVYIWIAFKFKSTKKNPSVRNLSCPTNWGLNPILFYGPLDPPYVFWEVLSMNRGSTCISTYILFISHLSIFIPCNHIISHAFSNKSNYITYVRHISLKSH